MHYTLILFDSKLSKTSNTGAMLQKFFAHKVMNFNTMFMNLINVVYMSFYSSCYTGWNSVFLGNKEELSRAKCCGIWRRCHGNGAMLCHIREIHPAGSQASNCLCSNADSIGSLLRTPCRLSTIVYPSNLCASLSARADPAA